MADIKWVYRDGARLTPWMLYQIDRLNADFKKEFGYEILVSSGVRLAAEQEAIFRARYVTAGNVRGRRVYDTRWWNGALWYRISSAGTVAAPNSPQANHQIRGTDGAVDLRDTGPDAGVMTPSSKRGKWIRANAAKYDLVAEGDGFKEGWHFKVRNVLKTPPSNPAGGDSKPLPSSSEEHGMKWVRSEKTKNWYEIGEFSVTKIPTGATGSPSHKHATAISAAHGHTSRSLPGTQVQALIKDAGDRAEAFYTGIGQSEWGKKVAADIALLGADED